MARHEPEGALLAIHSVCVAAAARRRGVATRLLRAYLQFVQASTPQLQEVRELAQEGEAWGHGPCSSQPGGGAAQESQQRGAHGAAARAAPAGAHRASPPLRRRCA